MTLHDIAGSTPEAVQRWFGETDAETITSAIRDADDDDLTRFLDDAEVRQAGVAAILERFAEFADPDRLAAVHGVVCFELGRGATHERRVVRFEGGTVTVYDGGDEPRPEVTIGADLVCFVRLVTGQRNAALLYLSDELTIEGDGLLALDVGCVFRLPGGTAALVDPTALDPVDVSRAIADVSTRHLHEVMGGPFREIVVGEVLRRIPEYVVPDRAARARVAIGFRVAGRPDGEPDRFVVTVDHGTCEVVRDPTSDVRRDATLVVDGPTFLRLVLGHLNPVRALLGGKLGLKGDRGKALAFSGLVDIPKP